MMDKFGKGQILLYDEGSMTFFDMQAEEINFSPDYCKAVYMTTRPYEETRIFLKGYSVIFKGRILERAVELDPTTMLKIAKYNKDVELQAVNRELESKKIQLKQVSDKLKKFNDIYEQILEIVEDGDNSGGCCWDCDAMDEVN